MHHNKEEEEKRRFFDNLQQVVDTCGPDKEIIVMGDLNGHVRSRRPGYETALGLFDVDAPNEEGEPILNFCMQNKMKLMNTYFQHQGSHKYTWYG
jgi:exonuclease III